MVTPRAWLASLDPPLAKNPSRGRFSAKAHAALKAAIADGMVFDEPAAFVKPEKPTPEPAPEPAPTDLIAEGLEVDPT